MQMDRTNVIPGYFQVNFFRWNFEAWAYEILKVFSRYFTMNIRRLENIRTLENSKTPKRQHVYKMKIMNLAISSSLSLSLFRPLFPSQKKGENGKSYIFYTSG